MMAVVGLLTLNFNVVLPAIAAFTFHGTATTYAIIVDVVAAGALVGAVWIGARSLVTTRMIAWASLAFGVALAAAAATDVFWAALIALAVVGATSVVFTASVQSVLQLAVEPDMRGRIVALYQIVYQGTTPLGALIVGWLASTLGARSGLVLGAAAALVAGVGGLWQERGRGREPAEAPVKLGAPGSEPGG
jgi:MFS family permease